VGSSSGADARVAGAKAYAEESRKERQAISCTPTSSNGSPRSNGPRSARPTVRRRVWLVSGPTHDESRKAEESGAAGRPGAGRTGRRRQPVARRLRSRGLRIATRRTRAIDPTRHRYFSCRKFAKAARSFLPHCQRGLKKDPWRRPGPAQLEPAKSGLPAGSRNKVTVAVESLMGRYGPHCTGRQARVRSDLAGARLVLER
jgi:hypothetical protein